jgi:hypothetical protein
MKAILLSAVLLSVLATGCRKDDNENNSAGKGGPATLRVTVMHHQAAIDSGTVRIKYNATQPPANGLYDDSADISRLGSNTPQALFPSLKTGNYYLSGRCYDKNVVPGTITLVVGGIPYNIRDTSVGVNVSLPVSEPGE